MMFDLQEMMWMVCQVKSFRIGMDELKVKASYFFLKDGFESQESAVEWMNEHCDRQYRHAIVPYFPEQPEE